MEYHTNLKRYVYATYSVSLNFWERLRARYVEHTCRERLRARYVEHTCSADNLLSVVVIAIWLRVMTQVVFGAAGLLGLFSCCSELVPTFGSTCVYVSATSLVSALGGGGGISGEHSCVVPSVFLISPVDKSDCIGISCGSGCVAPLFPSSKVGFS